MIYKHALGNNYILMLCNAEMKTPSGPELKTPFQIIKASTLYSYVSNKLRKLLLLYGSPLCRVPILACSFHAVILPKPLEEDRSPVVEVLKNVNWRSSRSRLFLIACSPCDNMKSTHTSG